MMFGYEIKYFVQDLRFLYFLEIKNNGTNVFYELRVHIFVRGSTYLSYVSCLLNIIKAICEDLSHDYIYK